MPSTLKPNRAIATAGVQALIAGTQKHFPSGSLTIGNAAYAPASLVHLFQSLLDAMAKQNATQKAATDALTELKGVQARANPIIKGYRDLLVAMFGNASQTLADFGMAPRKARTPLTVEKKAVAAAKVKATRLARGTRGPKARLEIKGTLPVTAPAATVVAPAKTS